MEGWSFKASSLRAHQLNSPVLAHKTGGLLNQARRIFHEPTAYLTLSQPTVPPRPLLRHKPDSVFATSSIPAILSRVPSQPPRRDPGSAACRRVHPEGVTAPLV